MSNEVVADLCILRSDDQTGWVVSSCQRDGKRCRLGHFASREEASEFALSERDRLRAETGQEPTVHLPDDCPCYRESRGLPDP